MPTERFLTELPTKPANEIEAARLEAWLMYEISKKQKFDSARKYWAGIACQIEAMPRPAKHAFEPTEGYPEDCVECTGKRGIHIVGGAN